MSKVQPPQQPVDFVFFYITPVDFVWVRCAASRAAAPPTEPRSAAPHPAPLHSGPFLLDAAMPLPPRPHESATLFSSSVASYTLVR
jgi:hypothetical protein